MVVALYVAYYTFKLKKLVIRKDTTDIHLFKQIFILREYGIKINIKPKFIVDAGANVGYATLWFNQKFPDAKIISIEPESSNFEVLRENTMNIDNIKILKKGLWAKKSFLKIIDNGVGKWGFSTEEVGVEDSYDIEGIGVDDILANTDFNCIDILKLDIEGAEKELFSENFESWLPKVNILIVELHDEFKEGCARALYSAIEGHDFEETRRSENVIFVRREFVF